MENLKNKLFMFSALIIVFLGILVFSSNTTSSNFLVITNPTNGTTLYNGVYGGFEYFNESGANFDFSTQDEWYTFEGGDCGLNNGLICDDTGENTIITIEYDGVYTVSYGATGKSSNNEAYISAISVNDIIQNNTRDYMITANNEIHKMRGDSELALSEGDNISLQIKNSDGVSSGTIYEFDVNVQRVGN